MPKLDVTLDQMTLMAELKSTSMVTITLRGSGGFYGPVGVTASAVDGAGAPITGWTVTLDKDSVDLAIDGTSDVVATVKVPSMSSTLAATVKVDVSSSLGAINKTATVNVQNQITFTIDRNNQCVYPADSGLNLTGPVAIARGTKVRFYNMGTQNFEIHSDAPGAIPHQGQEGGEDDPLTEPNTAYERTLGGTVGQQFGWYCHAPGPNLQGNNPRILVQ